MATDRTINEYVRQRLREVRTRKNIHIRTIAAGTGIATSSYCCMESGYYNISLDNLFRILGVLGTDIAEVWPAETAGLEATESPIHLRHIQEFRINEIISLSQADGAALFSLNNRKSKVLLYQSFSDYLLDRLCLYLEDGRLYDDGLWFQKQLDQTKFLFFLKGRSCPEYLRKLIEQYLVIWSNLFSQSLR